MDPALKRLGAQIAASYDGATEVDLERQRTRLLEHGSIPTPASWQKVALRPGVVVAIASALAIACAVYLLRPAPLHFYVAGVSGREGDWIAAPPDRVLGIAFSDGTQLVLAKQARARVVDLGSQGASIVLEQGTLNVGVVHRQQTHWRVNAGPFSVRITGTRFDVSWDPAIERLELVLEEGQVRVMGPTIEGERLVSSGERMEIVLSDANAKAASAPRAAIVQAPPRDGVAPQSSSAPAASSRSAAPTWREYAAHGQHAEAWRLVELEGFDAVLNRAGAPDLALLADVARFSDHPTPAVRALRELKRRFPGYPRAREAAFLLGRIHFDQRRSYAEAASAFSAYLAESPNGGFAQEAAGRLIESHQRSRAPAKAREAAERYLQAYPTGPYAVFARRLLDGGDGGTRAAEP